MVNTPCVPEASVTWRKFLDRLNKHYGRPTAARGELLVRGHACSAWTLAPTIDRGVDQAFIRRDRDVLARDLTRAFQHETLGLDIPLGSPVGEEEWELLGRHHGLSSRFLDWSRSPCIAAFFAFADPKCGLSHPVAVWVFDRQYFVSKGKLGVPGTPAGDPVELPENYEHFRFNRRAVEQQAVFMRVATSKEAVELSLAGYLWKYVIPGPDRQAALTHLSAMGITWRSLFRDLDGAARSAATRLLVEEADVSETLSAVRSSRPQGPSQITILN